MTTVRTIVIVIAAMQTTLMSVNWLLEWLYSWTVWQHMSDADRLAGHVPFKLAEYCRTQTMIGRVAWTVYLLSRWYVIVPQFLYLLLRGGRHDES